MSDLINTLYYGIILCMGVYVAQQLTAPAGMMFGLAIVALLVLDLWSKWLKKP